MKERILEGAAQSLAAEGKEDLVLLPGMVRHLPTGREITLKEMGRRLEDAERTVSAHFRAPVAEEMPTDDEALRLHGVPHLLFSYGAHLACVECDQLTGEVAVKAYLGVTDCGRIINPQVFEQQIHGGIAQGLGYALYEDLVVQGGMAQTTDLATYMIPTAMDLPDMETVAVESYEETGPFGMKGAGEIAMDGPLPAVANALADACRVRLLRSPFTAERVLKALEKIRKRG